VYIEQRVRFAFDAFGDAPLRIRLRLRDLNGPKGGVDKSCQVTAVSQAITVLVEDAHADEYVAVGRAVERAANYLRRRTLKRARQARVERAA